MILCHPLRRQFCGLLIYPQCCLMRPHVRLLMSSSGQMLLVGVSWTPTTLGPTVDLSLGRLDSRLWTTPPNIVITHAYCHKFTITIDTIAIDQASANIERCGGVLAYNGYKWSVAARNMLLLLRLDQCEISMLFLPAVLVLCWSGITTLSTMNKLVTMQGLQLQCSGWLFIASNVCDSFFRLWWARFEHLHYSSHRGSDKQSAINQDRNRRCGWSPKDIHHVWWFDCRSSNDCHNSSWH